MSLFPRRTSGKRLQRAAIERAKAHQVLDRAKAGHDVTAEEIKKALRITGDLEG